MRHRLTTTVILLLTCVLSVGTVQAGPQARVGGTVVNSVGEPIADATITLTSDELPTFEKTITTDAKGRFKVLILDATKTYLFTVTADGFLDYTEEIKVPVGTTDNDFTFELETQQEKAAAREKELMEQPGYKEYGEAVALLDQGMTTEARARFEDALAEISDLIQALEAIAGIDYDSGDYELALASARRCLSEDDESLTCLAIAANAAGNIGDHDAHARYLAAYQDLNPDDPATIFNQAVVHLNKMDDEQARPLLEQCLAVDPEYANCLFQYGMLLLRTGDLEGAKAHLEKYLEVAPEGPDAEAARETVKYL
jgi:tetratricopeptide (TPR) repeat protein